ncbi:MAG: sporulation protein YunB [Bacillaceae bacterium]|nr:sporulation protein YunB [Bacillaceae bacterium]
MVRFRQRGVWKGPLLKRKRGNGPLFNQNSGKKGPLPFRYVLLLSFVIFVVLTAQGLWLVEKGIRPTLIHIAKTETQVLGTEAINDAISKKIAEQLDMEELLIIEKDQNGDISSITFNSAIATRVQAEATQRVQRYLRLMEQGRVHEMVLPDGVEVDFNQEVYTQDGIIYTIPLGQATNNALLAHLGPQIPVRFTAIGDVKANMRHQVENTGINNTMLSLYLDLQVDVKIVIPFATDMEVVKTSIPIGMTLVPGKVPEYYNVGGTGPAPTFIRESEIRDAVRDN